ncbi:MAG: sigma 54-interacting transcriptional regulator [Fusobacteriaceae bacterium]|jgi:transcriptional regulator with PAS, ATPase and Fis domain|nr:sigma 54-interacting transcriptional regulator [Fusobacteriaceae bacterium]
MDLFAGILEELEKYAATISEVINMDVEMMDADFVRIAGTGRLREKVGLDMSGESHVYRKVLATGETLVILQPREEDICASCPGKSRCREILEVSTPILFREKPIGVIGLICFDEAQKMEFLPKKDAYIRFLQQMALFIGGRVYEAFEKKKIEERNRELLRETEKLKTWLEGRDETFSKDFIFDSPEMKRVYAKIAKVAKNDSTVLITGESGCGKEVAAREIHLSGPRRAEPFVAVNCGAIPETLMESEFFGYVKGAFTGANPRGKTGFFEQAHKGTLFLDEIGDMPLSLQVKLLRVIQEKSLTPLGADAPRDVDARIISATNAGLETLVEEGKFREDLYYRLSVVPIEIPPLRERPGDVENLIRFFIRRYAHLFGIPTHGISPEVMEIFRNYPWPGNIREVKNVAEYIVNILEESDREILPAHLPAKFASAQVAGEAKTLAQMEKEAIEALLRAYGTRASEKKKIASTLGIGLATLYRKLKTYGLC